MERLKLLIVLNLGLVLSGCPGDDGTDEGGDTGTAGDTTGGTTNPMNTTGAVDSSSGEPGSSSGEPGSSSGEPGSSSGEPGSSSGEPGDSSTGEPALSFANDVYPIIQANCGPNCHLTGGPGGLQMPDAATAYDNLVDVPANNAANGEDRVEPGSPDMSFLWRKLDETLLTGDEGDQMPDGMPMLDPPELAPIEQWILDGAQP